LPHPSSTSLGFSKHQISFQAEASQINITSGPSFAIQINSRISRGGFGAVSKPKAAPRQLDENPAQLTADYAPPVYIAIQMARKLVLTRSASLAKPVEFSFTV
jgi:hypothetical protein